MHRTSSLAMVAAIALTAGLVLVLGDAGGTHVTSSPDVLFDRQPHATTARSEARDADPASTVNPNNETPIEEILSADMETVGPIASSPTSTTTTPTTVPRSSPTTTAPRQSPTTTKAAVTTTPVAGEFRGDMEADFLGRVNAYRAANGLGSLSSDGSLTTRARDWSRGMADNGRLSHSNLSSLLPPWSAAGENVGRGSSVELLFNALVNSPSHRSNMLGNFTHVGIGVWRAADSTLWTTQVFTR